MILLLLKVAHLDVVASGDGGRHLDERGKDE